MISFLVGFTLGFFISTTVCFAALFWYGLTRQAELDEEEIIGDYLERCYDED
jgi:hypothetical protein